MAICPKCAGAMPQTAAVCPHCGYDFPFNEADFRAEMGRTRRETSFAFSDFADATLSIASVLFGIGAFCCAVVFVVGLFTGRWGFLLSSIPAGLSYLALSIVCVRALNWKKPQ